MTSDFEGQTCGIYPRVSTHKQAKNNRTSLRDQEEACRSYSAELGMVVDEACVKPEAYTSTVMQRPELNLLLTEMKTRRVRNLIIDRVDRMTRAGQIVAATFLQQFTRAGITLHIVAMGENGLVVQDDKGIKDFLDAAYQAQQDNKQRARIVRRAKLSRARAGHYLRGNHAPYGYRYVACEWDDEGNVTDKRLDPDERSYAERGYTTAFAPNPYAARKRVIQLYADGYSYGYIADLLTQAGVPTAAHLVGRDGTRRHWWPRTVQYIVLDPLNRGILTNFRRTSEPADPDDRHNEEWVKVRPVPREQQLTVTPIHGAPAPIVDEATATRIALRREHSRAFAVPSLQSKYAGQALLAGGLAMCKECGGTLRVMSVVRRRSKTYMYYACSRHRAVSSVCSGLSFPVGQADLVAWNTLRGSLLTLDRESNDNYLDVLAERQVDADSSGMPATTLQDLRAARDKLQEHAQTFASELGNARTALAREVIQREIDKLEQPIADATRKILAYERQAARIAERRALLADYLYQYNRYVDLVLSLDPEIPEHIPIMTMIARAVGARFTVSRSQDFGWPAMTVELLITPASAEPWFNPEQEQQLQKVAQLDKLRDPMVERAEPSSAEGERPPFAPIGSSLRRTSEGAERAMFTVRVIA